MGGPARPTTIAPATATNAAPQKTSSNFPPTPSSSPPSNGAALDGAAPVSVCPYFHEAVELIGKRWTGAIVVALIPGTRRFSEIAQAVPQISDRLLSMRLRELEAEGLVQRQVYEGTPVRVEYALTDMGRDLERSLSELRLWARQWLKAR
jgi:DNA-binding HxlR family transcriptional regulator